MLNIYIYIHREREGDKGRLYIVRCLQLECCLAHEPGQRTVNVASAKMDDHGRPRLPTPPPPPLSVPPAPAPVEVPPPPPVPRQQLARNGLQWATACFAAKAAGQVLTVVPPLPKTGGRVVPPPVRKPPQEAEAVGGVTQPASATRPPLPPAKASPVKSPPLKKQKSLEPTSKFSGGQQCVAAGQEAMMAAKAEAVPQTRVVVPSQVQKLPPDQGQGQMATPSQLPGQGQMPAPAPGQVQMPAPGQTAAPSQVQMAAARQMAAPSQVQMAAPSQVQMAAPSQVQAGQMVRKLVQSQGPALPPAPKPPVQPKPALSPRARRDNGRPRTAKLGTDSAGATA